MTEGSIRSDAIAQSLLEFAEFGKTTFAFPIKKNLTVDANDENPRLTPGNQRRFRELFFKGCEQLLRRPRRAHQPTTPHAVLDLDARSPQGAFGLR